MTRLPVRLPGEGWLVLLGGGEFSFGETLEADRAWIELAPPGPVAFLPTASGSADYGKHLNDYLSEAFERQVETVPVYRGRDARRRKNVERIEGAETIYLGGGVVEHLLETLVDSPAAEALGKKLGSGGMVVAIAAAAQALGQTARALGGEQVAGLGWLPGGVVEGNFSPAHDRRLRGLLSAPGVTWGLGLPQGSAILLGPNEETRVVGTVFVVEGAEGDLRVLEAAAAPAPD
jgi:cyanophycinase-like exopeptidase